MQKNNNNVMLKYYIIFLSCTLTDIINKESISKEEMDNDYIYEPVCVLSTTLKNETTGIYPMAMLRGGEEKDVSIELNQNVAYRHIDRRNMNMTANVAYGSFTTLHYI